MQVNRVDNRPNFKAVTISPTAKKLMLDRMPKEELDEFVTSYNKSHVLINIYNALKTLKANVRYNTMDTIVEESFLSSLFQRNPKGFLNKIGNEVDSIEETYMLTRMK